MTNLGGWLDRYCAPEEEPETHPRSQASVEREIEDAWREPLDAEVERWRRVAGGVE